MNPITKILKAQQEADIQEAIALLQRGELVALPTETVYGLAADAGNIIALQQIFTVKNRPAHHPLIVHIASLDELSQWATNIPDLVTVMAQHFWPGPLTLLLEKKDSVNEFVTGGSKKIAIRVPQNQAFLKILRGLKTGLAAPSANLHKRMSPTTAEHVISGLSGKIAAVVDDGPCQFGIESTILDLTENRFRILRQGPITQEMLEKVLNVSVELPDLHLEKVPGNMKAHYQPYSATCLMSLDEIEHYLSITENQTQKLSVIHYSLLKAHSKNIHSHKMPKNQSEYAHLIYQALHSVDKMNPDQILIERPPEDWTAILDRLSKACFSEKQA
jgi:L-threonylcarbamoyladenylate synthase